MAQKDPLATGGTLPGYGGGSSAPNLTAVADLAARKLKWYQHFDVETSSRALVNPRGGVETNTMNVCQVELVGTCDPKTHTQWKAADQAHVYWPDAPDRALQAVARFLAWMHEEPGVPLSGPKAWPAYPTYGSGGQRLTGAQWTDFKGVCGHMHVPENVHGDPGATDFVAGASNAYVLQLGRQLVKRGFGDHYKVGPSRTWGEADRLNTRDFQKSRRELRGDADGSPGPLTWRLLFS